MQIYIDFILKIVCKIYYNMFGSVFVDSVYSNLKPKPNQNFRFLKIKNQNRTKLKFWQRFGRFQPVFSVRWFFAHPTLNGEIATTIQVQLGIGVRVQLYVDISG